MLFLSFFVYFLYLHFKCFPLSRSPLQKPIPLPCLYEGVPPLTYPLPSFLPGIPLHWGIKQPQAQGLLLPLMSKKAIFCHIYGQCHGSLLVYSLVGVQSLGAQWCVYVCVCGVCVSGLLTLLTLHGAANPLSPFSNSSIWDP